MIKLEYSEYGNPEARKEESLFKVPVSPVGSLWMDSERAQKSYLIIQERFLI